MLDKATSAHAHAHAQTTERTHAENARKHTHAHTHTHTEKCAFPRQQQLRERASLLRLYLHGLSWSVQDVRFFLNSKQYFIFTRPIQLISLIQEFYRQAHFSFIFRSDGMLDYNNSELSFRFSSIHCPLIQHSKIY